MRRLLIFIILFTCLYSCNKPEITVNKQVAGYIGETPIYIHDIDKLIQQELYDQLHRIYYLRKTATKEYINQFILENEAKKHKISKQQYLNNYIQPYLNKELMDSFIIKNNITSLPSIQRSLSYLDINSAEGKKKFINEYKNHLELQLMDSLYAIYKPKIQLDAPLPPKVELHQLPIKYRGNLQSKVKLVLVSDMECSKCREHQPVYQRIFNAYKNKIAFGFLHYASYPTLMACATECASKQSKFWEMYDALSNLPYLPDTNEVFGIAKKLQLNMAQFSSDFYNPEISLQLKYNFKRIKNCGIYATPTIIINDKPIFDSSSEAEIDSVIHLYL